MVQSLVTVGEMEVVEQVDSFEVAESNDVSGVAKTGHEDAERHNSQQRLGTARRFFDT
jgi:hypothetical protein